MEDAIRHRLGLTERAHPIIVTAVNRKAEDARDVSTIKFEGHFNPEQIQDAETIKALWREPEMFPDGQLPVSDNPLCAVDAAAVRFNISSGKTRLRLARPYGEPLELTPSTVKLKEAILSDNKEMDRPPALLKFTASGIPSEQLFAKLLVGQRLGIAFELKDTTENTADNPEPEPAAQPESVKPKGKRKKKEVVAETAEASARTMKANRLNAAGLDSLPIDLVLAFETEPDAEGQVTRYVYTRKNETGTGWECPDGSLAGSFYLLNDHFFKQATILSVPDQAVLPEWASEMAPLPEGEEKKQTAAKRPVAKTTAPRKPRNG